MATDSSKLFVECQHALGMTQKEMGDLVGKDRRRWQRRGAWLMPGETAALAEALRVKRPDLADRVIALGQESTAAAQLGPLATPELVDDILAAAAQAIGSSPSAVRPALVAALAVAAESGVSVGAVLAAIRAGGGG